MTGSEPIVVGLVSLGCPKNLVDSERMLAALAEGGCVVTLDVDDADVVVVNTCGFLAAARDESMEVIGEAVAAKDAGRVRRVVVAGCLAQREGQALCAAVPGVDAVVGVNNREDLLQAVLADGTFIATDGYVVPAKGHSNSAVGSAVADDSGRLRLTPRHTAYLRVSEGCGRRCTFCTIPSIRGPFRSKPLRQVLAEAEELIADGAVELNVIGQDTTSYGGDIGYAAGPAGLLRELDALDGARWIRLLYAYPTGVTDDLIAAMAECGRVVPYLDLPLQHIADPILKAMGRRITRAETEQLLIRLREHVPGLALRTTFIVGFPGETEAHFQELLTFVTAFRFDAMGVFAYSNEPGTAAARLGGAPAPEVVAARIDTLMRTQQELVFAANAARTGDSVEVLVDGVDEHGRCVGRHAGQAPDVDAQCFLTVSCAAGSFVSGTIVGADGYDLIVEPARRRHPERAGAGRAGRRPPRAE